MSAAGTGTDPGGRQEDGAGVSGERDAAGHAERDAAGHAERDAAGNAERDAALRRALALVPAPELREAMVRAASPDFQPTRPVQHALRALHRHRDPVAYLGRPQYRPAVPYLVAAVSESCLSRVIYLLGEHAENPDRDQLAAALDEARAEYPDPTIAVMLAGVAADDMPASDLCFELLTTDGRYGLASGEEQPG